MPVILFHPEGEEYLKEMVLDGIDYTVFDPLKDTSYRMSNVVVAIYRSLRIQGWSFFEFFTSKRKLKRLARKIRAQIIINQLERYSPNVIVTFIDNSILFHSVCENYRGVPFLAIQNGGRYIWCASESTSDPDLKYHIDEYYCFGTQVQKLFEEYNHDIKKYIACGSLIGGYYFSTKFDHGKQEVKSFDVCLISQWSSHLSNMSAVPQRWSKLDGAINILTEYVAKYTLENKIKVCIALRSSNFAERDFYKRHFADNCYFKDCDRINYSSYQAVTESNLIIAINSTLASEVFGVGLKVLFVNPFGEEWLQPTKNVGLWYLPEPNYIAFARRVDALLKMSKDEYISVAGSEMKNTYSFNPDMPAHKVIRERLLSFVER